MRIAGIIAVAALLACAGERAASVDGDYYSTRDSAGVTIAANTYVASGQLAEWRIDARPSLIIGSESGASEYRFDDIGGVARLANGMIAIVNGADAAYYEIRFFDSAGKYVATHGRKGAGAGEFSGIVNIGAVAGDTVVVNDAAARRVSLVSATHGVVSTLPYDISRFAGLIGSDAEPVASQMVPLRDSAFAVKAVRAATRSDAPRRYSYHVVDARASRAVEVARHSDPAVIQLQLSTGSPTISNPESARPLHVVDRRRERLCVAVPNVARIECGDRSGARLEIRWAFDTMPISEEYRRASDAGIREKMAPSMGLTPADAEQIIRARVWPRWFNPFQGMISDTEGNIWIAERHLGAPSGQGPRVRVFSPEGREIARVSANVQLAGSMQGPFMTHPFEVGTGWALFAFQDENSGAPKVGVFRIHKSGR